MTSDSSDPNHVASRWDIMSWLAPTVVTMGVVGATLLSAAAAYVAYDEYQREFRHAQANLTILSEVVATGTEAIFAAIDRGLELAGEGYLDRLDASGSIDETDAHRYLVQIKESVPYLRGLGWFDHRGNRVASSFGTGRPPLNIAGETNFDAHITGPRNRLHVGSPVQATGLPGEWIVTVSRRVSKPNGDFVGVVNGVVDTKTVLGHQSDVAQRTGISFALIHASGRMIAREPAEPNITGRDVSMRPLFTRDLAAADRGISTTLSSIQNTEIMRAYYRLPDLPIIVTANQTLASIFSDWRARQYTNAIFVLGFIVAIAFGSSLLLRQYRQILRRQEELVVAKAAADAANRAKSAFISNMSHELRTPLNAVIGFAEIIGKKMTSAGQGGNPKIAEYAGDIAESGRRLLRVINNVLDLSRIELSHFVLKMGEVAIDELLTGCVLALRERAEAAGIEVRTRFLAHGNVRGDAERLRQAFYNVLDNAVRYTPRGGHVEIETVALPEGRFDIVIQDTGPGMSAEELELARQPFGQLHAVLTKPNDGPGLGLSVAEHFVRLHGGTFNIQSEKGRGTRVAIRLSGAPRIAVAAD